MSSWNDFNDAQPQNFDLIPKGTIVKARLTIRPGGHNDEQQGWTGGYATRNANTAIPGGATGRRTASASP